ncbi:hypothetical protein [Nocardia arizonensis]|uniref:hypothetical protein n=1 Tax=Nocardia arizonensis TaxID=1141647 RepID=UPI0006CFEB3B|nr:hypothetical protein [Nocardia arizonensis]
MNEIEYVFGTGDGTTHTWTSQADLDLARTGALDAVQLDFDGDGLADDALWDTTGSGTADIAALDLDDDGLLDHFYTDPTGAGTWDHRITGSSADADQEPLGWIVRTDPLPDTSSETNNPIESGPSEGPSDPARWRPDELMNQFGPRPDQRGRLLDSCAESGDHSG